MSMRINVIIEHMFSTLVNFAFTNYILSLYSLFYLDKYKDCQLGSQKQVSNCVYYYGPSNTDVNQRKNGVV